MSLPHTISNAKSPAIIDVRDNHHELDSSSAEVITLAPLIVEEKSAPPAQLISRPALPARVAIIGNYLPRRCGIATFTTDLCDAIHAEYGATELLALPINDTREGYTYPARIRFEIAQDELDSYRQAADFLNFSNIDLVCLQHEYGIFGGPAGAHILELLRRLEMPVVTTLHTVLRDPNPDQRAVMAGNCRPVGSPDRHEPAICGDSQGSVPCPEFQDRPDSTRHPRFGFHRSQFLQGCLRNGRQGSVAHLRPALAE